MKITLGIFETLERWVSGADMRGVRQSTTSPLTFRQDWIASYGVPIARRERGVLKILTLADDVRTAVRVKHQEWLKTLAQAHKLEYQEV